MLCLNRIGLLSKLMATRKRKWMHQWNIWSCWHRINEPISKTNGKSGRDTSETCCWYMQVWCGGEQSTVLLHCDIWNYLWEILSMMLYHWSTGSLPRHTHPQCTGWREPRPGTWLHRRCLRRWWEGWARSHGAPKGVDCASRSHGTQSNGCRACNFLRSSPFLSI